MLPSKYRGGMNVIPDLFYFPEMKIKYKFGESSPVG